eukprot:TRINITY_DN67189_c6_g8_i1.p1 TRINITY_DN67189_c6_g8~~TRINITY_DN67189_c6_g8_i1.p1  ORF type:complete len:643 (-),score=16.18 TRINITY_DN67189_c6_g8_i1:90-2018(-)
MSSRLSSRNGSGSRNQRHLPPASTPHTNQPALTDRSTSSYSSSFTSSSSWQPPDTDIIQLPSANDFPGRIRTFQQLEDFLCTVPTSCCEAPLHSLHQAIKRTMGEDTFFGLLLPQIINLGRKCNQLFTSPLYIIRPVPSTPTSTSSNQTSTSNGSLYSNWSNMVGKYNVAAPGTQTVRLSAKQCLALMCVSFLCLFPGRMTSNCTCDTDPTLPSINLDELYYPNVPHQTSKLCMILEYFQRQFYRLEKRASSLSNELVFARMAVTEVNWEKSSKPLLPVTVHPLHRTLDEGLDTLRVDFANAIIGGGALSYGCVQEEIMFALHPELIVTRLFFSGLQQNESLLMIGAERFSKPISYGYNLQYGGRFHDPAKKHNNILQSYFVAIDAVDYRYKSKNFQYTQNMVARDLCKAYSAFACTECGPVPRDVSTGNWGCGAFGGDPELKSIMQWLAASQSGRCMHYYPWDHEWLHDHLATLSQELLQCKCTVGDVAQFLFDETSMINALWEGKNVFTQLWEHFCQPKQTKLVKNAPQPRPQSQKNLLPTTNTNRTQQQTSTSQSMPTSHPNAQPHDGDQDLFGGEYHVTNSWSTESEIQEDTFTHDDSWESSGPLQVMNCLSQPKGPTQRRPHTKRQVNAGSPLSRTH